MMAGLSNPNAAGSAKHVCRPGAVSAWDSDASWFIGNAVLGPQSRQIFKNEKARDVRIEELASMVHDIWTSSNLSFADILLDLEAKNPNTLRAKKWYGEYCELTLVFGLVYSLY